MVLILFLLSSFCRFAGYLVRSVSMSNQDPNVIIINYVTLSPSVSSSSSLTLSLKPHQFSSRTSSVSSPLYSSNTTLYIKAADSEESDAILAGQSSPIHLFLYLSLHLIIIILSLTQAQSDSAPTIILNQVQFLTSLFVVPSFTVVIRLISFFTF